jgi:murein DD-endopeptidase MepM/ murein hydrolase activator NlpD
LTDLLRWGAALPDRRTFGAGTRSTLELIGQYRLSVSLGAIAAVGLGAAVWCGAGYLHYQQLAAGEQAAAIRAERVNADLQDALAKLQDQLGAARQTLNTAQSRISSLSDDAQQSSSKADRIAQLTRALEQAQRDLHLVEAQRATLMARVSKAETDLADGQSRQGQSQEWQKKVQQLTTERDKAAAERDQLRSRITELEKSSALRRRQAPNPVAQAQPQPAAPAAPTAAAETPDTRVAAVVVPAPGAAQAEPPRVASQAQPEAPRAVPAVATAAPRAGVVAHLERVLASAGVDVARLFKEYGVNPAAGGPFVPISRASQSEAMTPEKTAALATLLKVLPISAPLEGYEVSSPFGVRGDPVNGRGSFHTGEDLRAPYMSPVYATAPGVVIYAGYRDDYGKIVEIDHGNGLTTRYGHLHRYTVSIGQRVAAHTQIGFLGSTGRATGPHVHYEVLVNGEPQDPEKFLGLARVVAASQR